MIISKRSLTGNRVIVGTAGDSLDVPGYLESRDPETGAVQWRWNTTPRPGELGAETPKQLGVILG